MATRDVTVTVTVDSFEWDSLCDAAVCAGMTVPDYVAWNVRQIAQRSRPKGVAVPGKRGAREEAGETAAWTETFSQRLQNRNEQFRND
ncbi:hypothetical protein [Nocardia macrotermitis]|uniref:Uncharacterized protein n=1 Tax=Nocardia macrotermitis TaxID=2585198 RepID=A0A7K0D7L2_9NOCA|nr:hypothetical protein [Nocardia macrotermitis]MQY21770.1 hypothetical protein [Nocardia macrotermitis]